MIFIDILKKKYLIRRYERECRKNIAEYYGKRGYTEQQINREVNKVKWKREFRSNNPHPSLYQEYEELLYSFYDIYTNSDMKYHSKLKGILVQKYILFLIKMIRIIRNTRTFLKHPIYETIMYFRLREYRKMLENMEEEEKMEVTYEDLKKGL